MYSGILLIAGMIDLKCRKISQIIPLAISLFGLLFNNVSIYERIVGLIIPAFPLFILALGDKKLNGGDIKYLASLGFSIGINSLTVVLFFSVIISLVYSMLYGKKSVPLAFVGFMGYICLMWLLYINTN